MFIIKNYYYLYIENIKDLNIDILKNNKKINIILRNFKINTISELIKYKKKCERRNIKFYIANNPSIAKACNADGLYISSFNKKKYYINIPKIGSAHNLKEISEKIMQGCKNIIFSRLFKTQYKNKKNFHDVVKFNLFQINFKKNLIPLGGIKSNNLLKLNIVKCEGFALLSEIKKKPAIASRLF
jgi:thiamine monophosphate synthase